MDDLAFFDTQHLQVRGGIFDEAGKQKGVQVAGDVTGDGLEAIPLTHTEPVAAETANGDADGLRRRRSKKESTGSVATAEPLDLPDGTQATEIKQVARSGTEPFGQTRAFGTASLDATKKWFAHRSGASADLTVSSHSSLLPSPTPSPAVGAVPSPRTSSPRPKIEATGQGFVIGPKAEDLTASSTVQASTAADQTPSPTGPAPEQVDGHKQQPVSLQTRPSRSNSAQSSQSRSESQAWPAGTNNDEGKRDSWHGGSSAPPTDASAPTSNLMDTFRQRTADKKALQASVNQARDAMRKWGTNWSKGRKGFGAMEEDDLQNHIGEINGRTSTAASPPRLPTGARPIPTKAADTTATARQSNSLQDRLAAAAAAAASPPKHHEVMGISPSESALDRQHAATRRSVSGELLGRKDSQTSDVSTSSAPPAASGPSPHDNGGKHILRQQPTGANKAMVVPRIPKRPDAVMSMSSASASSATSAASAGLLALDEPASGAPAGIAADTAPDSVAPPSTSIPPPPLPARGQSEERVPQVTTDKDDAGTFEQGQAQGASEESPGDPVFDSANTLSDQPKAASKSLHDIPDAVAGASANEEDDADEDTRSVVSEPGPAEIKPTGPAGPILPPLPARKPMTRSASLRELPSESSSVQGESAGLPTAIASPASPGARSAEDALKKMVALDELARSMPGTPGAG